MRRLPAPARVPPARTGDSNALQLRGTIEQAELETWARRWDCFYAAEVNEITGITSILWTRR